MAIPLDQFLRDAVAPALKDQGYRRTKRVFTRDNAAGDRAFVEFRSHSMGDGADVNVVIDVALQPAPYAAWLGADAGSAGMIVRRPKQPSQSGRPTDVWSFNLDDGGRVRDLLESVLAAARAYGSLLDRGHLLQLLRSGGLPNKQDWLSTGPEVARALLLADAGPSAELEDLLPKIREMNGDLADFIVERARSNQRSDGPSGQLSDRRAEA